MSNNNELFNRAFTLDDGAMGTRLRAIFGPDALPEDANLEHPRFVVEVHRRYLQRNSKSVNTNTFGANTHIVKSYWCHRIQGRGEPPIDFPELAYRLNREGAKLARLARRGFKDVLVGGVVGPIRMQVRPCNECDEPSTLEYFRKAYEPQIRGLRDGGVDYLRIETVHSLEEADAAYDVCQRLAPDLPVVVLFAHPIGPCQALDHGDELAYAAWHFEKRGAVGIGLQCVRGPAAYQSTVHTLLAALEKRRTAVFLKPNCGVVTFSEGARTRGEIEEFAEEYRELVRILEAESPRRPYVLGGCCGTQPSHLQVIEHAVKQGRSRPRSLAVRRQAAPAPEPGPALTRAAVFCAIQPPESLADNEAFRQTVAGLDTQLEKLAEEAGVLTRLVITSNPSSTTPAGGRLASLLQLFDRGKRATDTPILIHHDCSQLGLEEILAQVGTFENFAVADHLFTVGSLASGEPRPARRGAESVLPFVAVEKLRGSGATGLLAGDLDAGGAQDVVTHGLARLKRSGASFALARISSGAQLASLRGIANRAGLPVIATLAPGGEGLTEVAGSLLEDGSGAIGLLLQPDPNAPAAGADRYRSVFDSLARILRQQRTEAA